ncbi:MAG: NAD(P)H-binding protein [Polyangiales bacterium]
MVVDLVAEPVRRRLLLTGATGFVGRHMDAALVETDWEVVRATRNRGKAAQPGWVHLDVEDPSTIAPAIEGCDAAVYLIHSIDDSEDYPAREARGAEAFRQAAERAGVRRIVYLGGVAPTGKVSRHLQSRLHTGEILRSGSVSTIELRCGLIIGAGGSSWMMVRDLAARLPAMLLPRWLQFSSWPVWIEDVVVAAVRALDLPNEESAWYDVPGSERMTHANFLSRIAKSMGKDPRLIGVPVITPTLSSYWIALVTRADLALARELVQGLQSDLDPSGDSIWELLQDEQPTEFQTAVYQALEDELAPEPPTQKLVRRMQARVKGTG